MNPPSSDIPTSPTEDDPVGIEHLHATLPFPAVDPAFDGYPEVRLAQSPWTQIAQNTLTELPNAGPGNTFYNIEMVLGGILNASPHTMVVNGDGIGALERTLANTLRQRAPHKHVVSSDGEQQIELGVVKEEDGEVVCCFSQAPLEAGDETAKLPCEHIFARDDLLKWLRTEQAVCPICRFALDSKEVPQSARHPSDDGEDELISASPVEQMDTDTETDEDMPNLITDMPNNYHWLHPVSIATRQVTNAANALHDFAQMPMAEAPPDGGEAVPAPDGAEGDGAEGDGAEGDGAEGDGVAGGEGGEAATDEEGTVSGEEMSPSHWRIPLDPQELVTMLMRAEFDRAAAREEEMALQAALWATYSVS